MDSPRGKLDPRQLPSGGADEQIADVLVNVPAAQIGSELRIFIAEHARDIDLLIMTDDPRVRVLAPRVVAVPWWAFL
jgi:hypothetical protein